MAGKKVPQKPFDLKAKMDALRQWARDEGLLVDPPPPLKEEEGVERFMAEINAIVESVGLE